MSSGTVASVYIRDMNSILHVPYSLSIRKATSAATANNDAYLYDLEIVYVSGRSAYRFHDVRIPKAIAEVIDSGRLKYFHMVDLEIGGPGHLTLPDRPNYVIVAAKTLAEESIVSVPTEWIHARRKGLSVALTLEAAAVFYACMQMGPMVSVAALVLSGFGIFRYLEVQKLNVRPFGVIEIRGMFVT